MFAARLSRFWLQIDENSIALFGRGFAVLIHGFLLLSPPTCAYMATWNCKLLSTGFPQRFCNYFDNDIKERRCQALTKEHKSCLGSGLPLFTELPTRVLLGNRASDKYRSRKLDFRHC